MIALRVAKAKTALRSVATRAPNPSQDRHRRSGVGASNQTMLQLQSRRAEGLTGSKSAGRRAQQADQERIAGPEAAPGAGRDSSRFPVLAPDRPSQAGTLGEPMRIKEQVNHPLEHEADRRTGQMMSPSGHVPAKAAPTASFTPAPTRLTQRKCTCGGDAGLHGECSECQHKRLSGEETQVGPADVQPLSAGRRHDYSQNEIHAEKSELSRMSAFTSRGRWSIRFSPGERSEAGDDDLE
jgi:hypothetical protein